MSQPASHLLFFKTPVALSILAWGVCVCAQEPTLGTVNVTSKGYASTDIDTPMSTATLDTQDLNRRGSANVGDALRGEPGFAVANDGAYGQNPVIRGLKKESIVLLVDGMRLNSAQPQGAIASFMTLGLAERVEAVKGPASVLYGTGALGGAINVLLPQARFDSGLGFKVAASLDLASQGLHTSGVLNTSTGDHALVLGASVARVDDYKAPTGTVARSGYDSDAFIAQYRYRIDAAQQLRVSLQQNQDDDVWYPGSRKPHPAAVAGQVTVHSPQQQRNLAELGYSRKGSGEQPLNVDVRAYKQDVLRHIHTWSDGLRRDIGKTKVTFATHGLDAKADWLVHPQHLLSFGTNAWRMAASPDRYLANPTPASPLVRNTPFTDGRLEALGLYVQDDMRLGAFNVLAGLRHDRVKGNAASMNNGAVTTGLTRTDHNTAASLGVSYAASDSMRPFVNISRGYRAGEMRERYEASPRGDGYHYLGNPQIRPEQAIQYELGVKGQSDAFAYTVSAYRTRITDYITGRSTGSTSGGLPVRQTVNLGRVQIAGLEAQARWQFTKGQWANVAYSHLRGTNKDLYEPLFQMPANELSVGWEGQLTLQWSADARARLVAKQDRVAAVFARGTENATPGFGTLDVGATWRYSPKQSLRFAVLNLGNKTYHEHLAEGISGQEIKAPGRSLQVVWNGSF